MTIPSFKEFVESQKLNRQILESVATVHPVFKSSTIIQKALQTNNKPISANDFHAVTIQTLKRIIQSANEVATSDASKHAFLIAEQNVLIASLILLNLNIIEQQQTSINKLSAITQMTTLKAKRDRNAN
ncbi:MAG: hypothetical protein EBQ96_07540 [Proteobacteria bacterium]|nr:hypothetical protein [Pseudomonadota bacterium]